MSHCLQQLDLRHTFLVVINCVKFIGHHTSSDPFHIISNLTWPKFTFLAITFFFFSFTSFTIRPSPPSLNHHQRELHVRIGNFSPTFAILLVASLLFPQNLFWYAYPIFIIICYLCSTSWVFNIFNKFMLWARAILPENIPDLNFIVTATYVVEQGQDIEIGYPPHPDGLGSEDGSSFVYLDIEAL